MLYSTFCHIAQVDQNDRHLNHLFANLRHSTQNRLIPSGALREYQECLSAAGPEIAALDPSSNDYSGSIATLALGKITDLAGMVSDYRFCGPDVPWSSSEVFVNLAIYEAPLTPTGAMKIGKPKASNPQKLVWVTSYKALIERLSERSATLPNPLSTPLSFFRELVDLLGLRPWNDAMRSRQFVAVVRLFKVETGARLHRPHGLSGGYADRFCGVSSDGKFGSTADNRDGEAGLPEAICRAKALIELGPSTSEYEHLKANLGDAPWIEADPRMPVTAVLNGSDLYQIYDYDRKVQPRIVERLSERLCGCGVGDYACLCV